MAQHQQEKIKREKKHDGLHAVEMLSADDLRVREFFAQVDQLHPFKVGMDSCNVPSAIQYCRHIRPESMDTCEGGRFSCYISTDMFMTPCSFDQGRRYYVPLRKCTIEAAWNSVPFEAFREKMLDACPDCDKKEFCMGGCPLILEIVFCNSSQRDYAKGE